MLTLAMARLAGYPGDGHVKLAAAVEFMHTATLLHDDVVDESECGAGGSPPACCGATKPACWSAISCSGRRSR
jgi:geranylgeranyl pyrophosphate synthase